MTGRRALPDHAIALTVLVSVVAHGFTAARFSRRCGEQVASLADDAAERTAVLELVRRPQTTRRRTRRAAVPELGA